MSALYHSNLELILVDWIGAHRDRDIDRLAALLHADVEQRWIDGKVYCANRAELLDWIEGQMRRRPTEYAIEAVEVVRGDDEHVVMGVHGGHLEEVGGEYVGGHLYEVFTIREGRIAAIRDFRSRGEALAAAGVDAASWR
jgi:ketosteroid isomerase-like protein